MSSILNFLRYNPLGDSFASNRDLLRVKRASLTTIDPPREKEIVILHGWHSLYRPLLRLENKLREQNPNARIWRVEYDSHWKTFSRSAREVRARMAAKGIKPENTVLVGYSMGGVVSRAMVAQGFNARAVACLCTPHRGPALFIPAGDIGSASILGFNAPLKHLNNDPRDIERRGDYFFQAINFCDANGCHRHDRVVSQRSALGQGLEGVGKRHLTTLNYKAVALGPYPHIEGMNPDHLNEALAWVKEKLND